MKGISKKDLAEHSKIVDKLNEARTELDAAKDAINVVLEDARDSVQTARDAFQAKLDTFNEALGEARDWREQIVSEIEDYVSDKSEKWQEGERGSAYAEWRDELENIGLDGRDFDDLNMGELEMPDELTTPELDCVDEFEQLPQEPAG